MEEKKVLSTDEIVAIENSAAYGLYHKLHPEATVEQFVEDKVSEMQGYLFAKKYNKALSPWEHFMKRTPSQRQEMLNSWNDEASREKESSSPVIIEPQAKEEKTLETPVSSKPKTVEEILAAKFEPSSLYDKPITEIYKAISKYSKNKLALDKILQDTVLMQAVGDFMQKFQRQEVAVTSDYKDALKYFCEKFVDDKDKPEISQLINDGWHLNADRYIDFEKDDNFQRLINNIPELKKEYDQTLSTEFNVEARLSSRQKIVDFARFMESGKKQIEMMDANNWEFMQKEYQEFPRLPSSVLQKYYDTQKQKDPKSDRMEMMERIVLYRIEDIKSKKWEISSQEEMQFLERFAQENPFDNEALNSRIKNIIKIALAEFKQKEEKAAQEKIEQPQAPVIAKDAPVISETITEKPQEIIDEKQVPVVKKRTIISQAPTTEAPENKKDEKITEDKPVEKPVIAEKKADPTWKDEIWSGWEEWAKKNNKAVAKYENEGNKEALSLKVFGNSEDQKKDLYEADITYASANEIMVKGRDGLVPDLSTFEEIVRTAKKNGPEIEFGAISSPEFKAKLLLVCLNDPEIKIINQPKMEDLKDISAELRKAIEEKLPPQEEKKYERKPYNRDRGNKENRDGDYRERKPREYRENRNDDDEGDARPPRRKYTPEQTAAYLEGKRQNKDGNNGERKHRYTPEQTAEYLAKKKKQEALVNN